MAYNVSPNPLTGNPVYGSQPIPARTAFGHQVANNAMSYGAPAYSGFPMNPPASSFPIQRPMGYQPSTLRPVAPLPTPGQVFIRTNPLVNATAPAPGNVQPNGSAVQNYYYNVSGKTPPSKQKDFKKFMFITAAVMTGMVATMGLTILGLRIKYPNKFNFFNIVGEEPFKWLADGAKAWNRTEGANPIQRGLSAFKAFSEAYQKRPKPVQKEVGYLGRLWNAVTNKQVPVTTTAQVQAQQAAESKNLLSFLPQDMIDTGKRVQTALNDFADMIGVAKKSNLTESLEKLPESLDKIHQMASKAEQDYTHFSKEYIPYVKESVTNFRQVSQDALGLSGQAKADYASMVPDAQAMVGKAKTLIDRVEPQVQETIGNFKQVSQDALGLSGQAKADYASMVPDAQAMVGKAKTLIDRVEPQVQETIGNFKQVSQDALGLSGQAKADYSETMPIVRDAAQTLSQAAQKGKEIADAAKLEFDQAIPTVQNTVSNLKQVSDDAVGLITTASKDYQETIPNVKASIQNAADATSRPVSFLMGWGKKAPAPPVPASTHNEIPGAFPESRS